MTANGKMIKNMEKEQNMKLIKLNLQGSGNVVKRMGKVLNISFRMGTFFKEHGKMVNQMAK